MKFEETKSDWEPRCSEITSRDPSLGKSHALVVQYKGEILHEWYGPGFDSSSTFISWSIAKSITHALVGMAVQDSLLSPNFCQLRPEWENDERSKITLDHLLQMTSGLQWVEDYIDDQSSDVIRMLFGESDFVGDHAGFAAAKKLEHQPGSQWLYSSGTTNIICDVLARALEKAHGGPSTVTSFMQKRLFDPLGMKSATAKCDAVGNFVGSSYVFATARDFVRFGDFYLNDGVIKGQRLLPKQWVDSARQFTAFDPFMSMSYGRQWWMWPTDSDSLIAQGYLGQILWVSPRRELVIAHLGNTDGQVGPSLRSMVAQLVEAFPQLESFVGDQGTDVKN